MFYQRPRARLVACIIGFACLTSVGFYHHASAEKPKSAKEDKDLTDFMREKLKASEQILEGMCVEDFKLIQDGAAKLQKLSQAEKWRISNDIMYRQHSAEFSRVVTQLEKQAKNGNLEGSALSWIQATMSCIECHKFVRATLIAEKE